MKKYLLSLVALASLCACAAPPAGLTSWVDPMIGSSAHGHVFVGASVPFGAVQVGPSNIYKGWDWCSGYHYGDSVIIGFPHTHLSGTGIGDLGDVLIMPYTGDIRLGRATDTTHREGYGSIYSHDNETVRPGYYSVLLDDSGIEVELTATARVGFHKYKFPQEGNGRIIIDLQEAINDRTTESYIEQKDDHTLLGVRFSSGWARRQQLYFAIKSSVPLSDFQLYEGTEAVPAGTRGRASKGLISFDKSPGEVMLKVGISPVSPENALANIEAEIPDWNFNRVVRNANDLWEKELSKIAVETANEDDKRIFYTSLYHTMINPALFNDANGEYRGADWEVHENGGFDNYTVFSLWDTYRAANPLFVLMHPERTADFVNSMLAISDQGGLLPIWHLMGYETGTMVGVSSHQVIAEAYLKGIKGFDAERAFAALKKSAMSERDGMDYWRDLKPIPSDRREKEPVAMGMEYAIGDGSIALMAKAMGKTDEYEYFTKRAQNYKAYWDPEVEFFRGRLSDGKPNPVFDPLKSKRPWSADYSEGNAWQYLWLAPQDVQGLVEVIGGEEKFIERLDKFFVLENEPGDDVLVDLTGLIGQYAHGNEPSHHITYLYPYVGQPWKTARLVRYIMDEFYTAQPDGVIGNEDCGQMSAWYVLSSMGLYPVFTASGEYVIGSPIFDKVTMNLDGGKSFTVETVDGSDDNIYVQSAQLNGVDHPKSYISHSDIMAGGTLTLQMGPTPSPEFGVAPENRPK